MLLISMANGYFSVMAGEGEDGVGLQTQTASTEESACAGAVCTLATGGLSVGTRCKIPKTIATQPMQAFGVDLLDRTGTASPCPSVVPGCGIPPVCCSQCGSD